MKNILLLLTAVFIVSSAFSQKPPRKIEKAFKAQYPDALDVKWENDGHDRQKIKENIYKARYHIDGVEMTSDYDYYANWLMTVTFIDTTELPKAIMHTLYEDYNRAVLQGAGRIEEPDMSSYGVILVEEELVFRVQLSEEGKILRRRYSSDGLTIK